MESTFKVVVAGGRDFGNYMLLKESLDVLLARKVANGTKVIIISGMARGADSLGEKYAKEKGYEVSYFPAKWNTYGRSAGYKRNIEMAQNADAVVAFWDGQSRGTKHMIDTASAYELPVRVIHY